MALNRSERPVVFTDVVGQEYVVKNLSEQSKRRDFFQVYVFGGQYGSGKTTMARILSRAVNCDHVDANGNPCGTCPSCKAILARQAEDVLEIDAASNTGVDNIRNLKEIINFLPAGLKKRVIVIDEVHRLSGQAFDALLKVLEEPPEHVIFVLCTTDVRSIPNTVLSRSVRYNFAQIPQDLIYKRLKEVAGKYQIDATEEGLRLIAKNSSGSMRNALNLLEQVSKSDKVTSEAVGNLLGITDTDSLFGLLNGILKGDIKACLDVIDALEKEGKDLFLAANDLLEVCTDMLEAYCSGTAILKQSEQYVSAIRQVMKNQRMNDILLLMNGLMELRNSVQANPLRTTFVIGIVKLIKTSDSAIIQLSKKVAELEEKIEKGNFVNTSVPEASDVGFIPAAEVEGDNPFVLEVNSKPEEVKVEQPVTTSDAQSEPQEMEKAESNPSVGGFDIWDMLDSFQVDGPKTTTSQTVNVPNSTKVEEGKNEQAAEKGHESHSTTNVEEVTDMKMSTSNTEEENDAGFFDMSKFDDFSSVTQKAASSPSGIKSVKETVSTVQEDSVPTEDFFESSEWKEKQGILNFLFAEDPLLETALCLGCDVNYDNGLVYWTKYEPVYRIIRAYQEAGKLTKVPFRIELLK